MSQEDQFVALTEDAGLKKHILKEGSGECPPVGSSVDVHYVGTLYPSGDKFDSSRDRPGHFTFSLGVGQVIKGWDEGVKSMKVGELAELLCSSEYAYGDNGAPPKIPGGATLKFEVELLGFTEPTDTDEARIRVAGKKKAEGNALFGQGQWDAAITAYSKGLELLSQISEPQDTEKTLELAILGNKAQCQLKLTDFSEAARTCQKALLQDPGNIKAQFRLAHAYLGQAEYAKALEAAEAALKLDPENDDLKQLRVRVQTKEAEYRKNERKMYANMFS
ncbi:hypothetical protein BJ684DRAFT_16552 [Piptocephalis cylindrospora]|uniref:peptidylprolyl isomerase n=1 Tax=Piptocephalis cylindrospora TaxID=1907219 RepID=A0A4V1IY18_9FUNG|nr:hypothetical protein BJ684DRAFT_16552 [Piptocephalis cylindrospora]|eukprot:RKP13009.1 hypothetical protein BJ684DRAFT_16552 [Piptocephalis cylindrospora]